jgi:hypothetical protein
LVKQVRIKAVFMPKKEKHWLTNKCIWDRHIEFRFGYNIEKIMAFHIKY